MLCRHFSDSREGKQLWEFVLRMLNQRASSHFNFWQRGQWMLIIEDLPKWKPIGWQSLLIPLKPWSPVSAWLRLNVFLMSLSIASVDISFQRNGEDSERVLSRPLFLLSLFYRWICLSTRTGRHGWLCAKWCYEWSFKFLLRVHSK